MQITNQMLVTGSANNLVPTAINANNGFRWGILGAPAAIQNGNAFIYNQEKRHLIFSTGNATPTNMAATGERMRITAIENPTTLAGGAGYGVYNPAGLNSTYTRISISEDPATPVTRPLSLVHLGYNTQGAGNDGWRNWMDVGTFTASSSDNMYVGLKQEPTAFPIDRFDAVINWGDNSGPAGPFAIGPDNLRFIFTSTTTGTPPGLLPATGADGLEGMRMTPSKNVAGTFAHVWTGIGGDPTIGAAGNLYGPLGTSINPTQTLEVNSSELTSNTGGSSGLRFTNLNTTSPTTATNPGLGVLAVNASGDVIYVPASNGTGIGNYCAAAPNPIVGTDYEIPLNTFNYRFTGQAVPLLGATNKDVVGIGYNCGLTMPAKFSVLERVGLSAVTTIAGSFLNSDVATGSPAYFVGVQGRADGPQPSGNIYNIGGYFSAINAPVNIGVYGSAPSIPASYAGYFAGSVISSAPPIVVSDQIFKTNVNSIQNAIGILKKIRPHTYDMDTTDYPQFNFETVKQYGFIAQEVETVLPELIHQSKSPIERDSTGAIIHPAVDYKALNYNAFIPITVQAINELGSKLDNSTLSDQTLKTNVQNLSGSLDKVKQMRGVTYNWNSSAQSLMNLDSAEHIGFIAQEINTIEPLLTFVDDSSLMHVNYDRVIPLLVESIKDLDNKMVAKDSIINVLKTNDSILDYRLTILESALNACCNNNHSVQQNNNSNNLIAQQDVNLKDGQAIVLDQNVPNPFAEQTTINYFLPENVVRAQLLFYNVSGKLIQSVDLNEKGKGSLNVFSSDLSNGIYTYTLVVDGKIIETKKMVKQQ